jgi:alkanesulfonate monooxygenase SsuD/methylene tetrahydromethanopterin reductase-like flavin-dependent oxidoreductase (luciferase family)
MTRQMAMVGFLQAQNCTNLPSSWRHPESRDDSMSADYYQEIARILEAGKFHMAFFDDRLAMPDRYGNDHAHTVEYGIRCVKMDPIVVLTTISSDWHRPARPPITSRSTWRAASPRSI